VASARQTLAALTDESKAPLMRLFSVRHEFPEQWAALTRAPGAPPQAEDGSEQRTDTAMESVALLRLKGKLDRMLPRADALAEHPPLEQAGFVQQGALPAATTEGTHQ